MRQNLIAGNWKMNPDYQAGLAVVLEITNMVADEATAAQTPQVVICPPFPFLSGVAKLLPAPASCGWSH